MTTVTVSIGNRTAPRYGAEEFTAERWEYFKDRVRDALAEFEFVVYVDGAESTGEWDGVPETSATWVASVKDEHDSHFPVEYLKGVLSFWADEFYQDAIAVTVGTTDLVSGLRAYRASR
jgi:hypothetical protein